MLLKILHIHCLGPLICIAAFSAEGLTILLGRKVLFSVSDRTHSMSGHSERWASSADVTLKVRKKLRHMIRLLVGDLFCGGLLVEVAETGVQGDTPDAFRGTPDSL